MKCLLEKPCKIELNNRYACKLEEKKRIVGVSLQTTGYLIYSERKI